jgi:hypothetical protein
MDRQVVFRSWARFFAITTLVGGSIATATAVLVALALGIVIGPDTDPRNWVGGLVGWTIGLAAFAWVSYLAYVRAVRALLQQVPPAPVAPRS